MDRIVSITWRGSRHGHTLVPDRDVDAFPTGTKCKKSMIGTKHKIITD